MPDSYAHSGFIDLHSHTTESDGSLTPDELVTLAFNSGLEALAITDHDTFSGFEQAVPFAASVGLHLVRGIELNSRLDLADGSDYRAAHILGYFPANEPEVHFRLWLQSQRDERRERNRRLAGALQKQGVKITLAEVEARGRTLTGRTHFAQILLEKNYVASFDEAFTRYLGRGATSYIERESQSTAETISRIRGAGGIPSLAHPIRLNLPKEVERRELALLKDAGLVALEVIHSDHSAELQSYYADLASDFGLIPTGGSDFHGAVKPNIELGRGTDGNVRVPAALLAGLQGSAVRHMVSAG